MTKAAYVGVAELPAGYTRLEYVESDGNQYIDTGYVPKSNASAEVDITYIPQVGNTDERDAYFFGSFDGENALMLNGRDNHSSYVSVGTSYVGMDCYTDVEYTLNISFDGVAIFAYSVTINSSDEVYEDHTDGGTFDGTLPANRSIYLFSLNYDDNDEPYRSFLRIKHFSYKDDGNLVRNYIPVTNPSGVAGLFDTVEQKFYSSNTSTALIAGPAVSSGSSSVARKIKKGYIGVGYTRLEYIESGSNQYIDTGVTITDEVTVEHDVQMLTTSSTNYMGGFSSSGGHYWGCTRDGVYTLVGGYDLSEVSGFERNTVTFSHDGTNCSLSSGGLSTSRTTSTKPTTSYCVFALVYNGSAAYFAKARLYGCVVRVGGTLVRDYVPAKNGSGEAGLFDLVTMTFYKDAAGVGFIAGPVMTTTTPAVARKIKKAYIGVGGVARPFWSGGELAYYGTATNLGAARYNLAATTVGNYALFGGGLTGSAASWVDAYDAALVLSKPSTLNATRCNLAATTVGNYALFGGGWNNSSSYRTQVDAYDTSLTLSSATTLARGRYALSATTVGNYALFGGGRHNSGYASQVDAYDSAITRSTPTSLGIARQFIAATTVGNYALFGGGYASNGVTAYVDAYDTALTLSAPTALSVATDNIAATTVGNYALFGDGRAGTSVVQAYDTSLTRSFPAPFSMHRYLMAATTIGDYALFGGGYDGAGGCCTTVDAYDTSLTRSTPPELSMSRYHLVATTVGNYALFGGGYDTNNCSSVVDVYTIA